MTMEETYLSEIDSIGGDEESKSSDCDRGLSSITVKKGIISNR